MNAEDRRCLLDLPMDIHYRLFGHLTTKDIVKLALMSNAWKEIVQQATAEVFIFRPKAIFSRHHEKDRRRDSMITSSLEASIASRLTTLKVLVVDPGQAVRHPFTYRLFHFVYAFTELEVLDIRFHCAWREPGPNGNFESWRTKELPVSLRVFRTDITMEEGIPEAAKLVNLKFLEYRVPPILSQIEILFGSTSGLRVLKLNDLSGYNIKSFLAHDWKSLEALEVLDFCFESGGSDASCRVLRSLPVLKSLKVWRLENISFGAWDVPLVFGKQSSLRRLQVRSQHSSYGALQSFLALSQINELIVHMTGYYDRQEADVYWPTSKHGMGGGGNLQSVILTCRHSFGLQCIMSMAQMPQLHYLAIEGRFLNLDLCDSEPGPLTPSQADLRIEIACRKSYYGQRSFKYLESLGFEEDCDDQLYKSHDPQCSTLGATYLHKYPSCEAHLRHPRQAVCTAEQDLDLALGPDFKRQPDNFRYIDYLQEVEAEGKRK